jgi:hypothetical protein
MTEQHRLALLRLATTTLRIQLMAFERGLLPMSECLETMEYIRSLTHD